MYFFGGRRPTKEQTEETGWYANLRPEALAQYKYPQYDDKNVFDAFTDLYTPTLCSNSTNVKGWGKVIFPIVCAGLKSDLYTGAWQRMKDSGIMCKTWPMLQGGGQTHTMQTLCWVIKHLMCETYFRIEIMPNLSTLHDEEIFTKIPFESAMKNIKKFAASQKDHHLD